MADESDDSQPTTEGPPPQAVERLKKERDAAVAAYAEVQPVLENVRLIDQLYEHFKGQEDPPIRDPYALAKKVAPAVRGAKDPVAAASAWVEETSALFAPPQAAPPPMAAGGSPAAAGVSIDNGPFQVGSKEWKGFVEAHGMEGALAAIANGQFFHSQENQAAQSTARMVR